MHNNDDLDAATAKFHEVAAELRAEGFVEVPPRVLLSDTPWNSDTVFDVIEAAYAGRKDYGARVFTHIDLGYAATAFNDKVTVKREDESLNEDKRLVRVHVIDVGYGIIRQVRFDSNNRAIYDIVLDTPVGPENDQSRDWVARREELEEISEVQS